MAALFVPLDGPLMRPERRSSGEPEAQGIQRAERLLQSLTGIVSARMVASPGGEIQEIHILTTEEVAPKQTVRNVESALLAELGIEVDHRKISVAQTKEPRPAAKAGPPPPAAGPSPPAAAAGAFSDDPRILQALPQQVAEERILFVGHQVETQRSHQVRMRVVLEWRGAHFEGEAMGAEVPRARPETIARATLRAVESVLRAGTDGNEKFSLALDGVRTIDAFDRQYVLVSVHGITGRDVTALSGAGGVDDAPDRSVILATLQATDRWVRGRI